MPRFRHLSYMTLLSVAAIVLASVSAANVILAQQEEPSSSESDSGTATSASDASPADAEQQGSTETGGPSEDQAAAPDSESETGTDTATPEKAEFKLPPPPPTAVKTPIEMQRYQVELPIVFQPSVKLGPAARTSIINEVRTILDRNVGVMWDLKITEPDWITPRDRRGLDRLSVEQLKQRAVELRYAEVIREQLSEYTESAFPVEAETPISDELRREIRRVLDTTDNETLQPMVAALVDRIAAGKVAAEKAATVSEVVFLYLTPPPLAIDKVFPVSIESHAGLYSVSAREWDRESELLTTVRTRPVMDRRGIAMQVIQLLSEVFRPVAQIDEADPTSARIRFKAGEYPPADPAFAQAEKGSMFTPFFRYLDRNKVLQKIQFLPWSYITVREMERIRANCDLDTGVKTPLGSFRRRRMDIRALALKPWLSETTLTLVPKRNTTRPLVGYLVAVYDEIPPPPPKPGEEPPEDAPPREKPEIHRSDRFGNVTIPVDSNKPLQWVYIRSGSALLAKFPLVSGAEAQMTVECPDDTIRLDVEGQIVLLQSQLIDTIAKQAMVKAMIMNRAKKGEWKKVDESMDELSELPGIGDFEQLVSEIQYPAIKKAQSRNDRISERRIKKLGTEVLKVARIHLDQEKIDEFREEIIEQRRIEDPNAGGRPRQAPGQR